MKTMNKITVVLCILSSMLYLTGCKDYLSEPEPGATKLEDYFTSSEAYMQTVNGCYVPLMWEFNQTYYSEWFIGDIVSDDALKGGENVNDMAMVLEMENWKVNSINSLLLDFYRAQYQGIGRCNLALQYLPDAETDTTFTESKKNRLIGEVYFLRAYYYFRLLRVFGGVPLPTAPVTDTKDWEMARASVEDVFTQIVSDLTEAQAKLWKKSEYDASDLGRATQGAAQAMLQKVYLYMASPYWAAQLSSSSADNYKLAKQWGQKVISSGEYDLVSNYKDQFLLSGENGKESVFEIQYANVDWGDYGGNGYTAGSFTQVLVRSRTTDIGSGWGFNRPTWNLYYEFETGDPRRAVAILNPPTDLGKDEESYHGTTLLNRKYGMYDEFMGKNPYHDARGPLNNKQIRYADVLLMQAEACCALGDDAEAIGYLNEVRNRVGLTPYADASSYTIITDAGAAVSGTPKNPTLKEAIRHERRVELAMEAHRWYDLVRWYGGSNGELAHYFNVDYPKTETSAVDDMGTFRAGVNEIFPIPAEEMELNSALEQNYGY